MVDRRIAEIVSRKLDLIGFILDFFFEITRNKSEILVIIKHELMACFKPEEIEYYEKIFGPIHYDEARLECDKAIDFNGKLRDAIAKLDDQINNFRSS